MSEAKLISPMLDNFAMGSSISEHNGVHSYPAIDESTDGKYIVKVISIPASRSQLDALLLSGAYPDEASAQVYFKELADGVIQEAAVLERLSKLDGFVCFDAQQCVEQEDSVGYDIYLLGKYRRTLERQFQKDPLTHLGAINLGLDLCSALMVCRRAGYLYADLRPSNVYLTDGNAFRIGDLGFLRMDGLKYASLPDKYRSAYTAPEIADAFSELNSTIDVYAVGLILYQAYNGGLLPFTGDTAPAEQFPAPAYADYEMAEIILKACAPDPADRWENPMLMGQALVSYMQRNGANDTPIVPPPVVASDDEETAVQAGAEEASSSQTEEALPTANADKPIDPSVAVEPVPSTAEPAAAVEPAVTEEAAVTAAAIPTDSAPSTPPSDEIAAIASILSDDEEIDPASITYDEVSEDLTQMLNQVDEIASHQVPDPVVAPEAIDVPIPDPIILSAEEDQPQNAAEEHQEPAQPTEQQELAEDQEKTTDEPAEDKPKKKHHWIRNSLIILFLLALIGAGIYFYSNYYLVPIEAIVLDGSEDSLTVQVTSQIDESLLTVICSDTHGNQITSAVTNGIAEFKNLVPDTAYTVTVEVNGFHKLTGDTSKAYSTPVQTNIVQFNAVTGGEDGSVILGFTVDGPDSEQWTVIYSARGEEEKSYTFPSHMATITGLTVGKEYSFTLVPVTDLYVSGTDTITYTASKLAYAEKLWMTSYVDGKLSIQWDTPVGMKVDSWSARCYNTDGYNETVITSKNEAVFENIDSASEYTVEVTAAGMSVSQRTFINKDSVSVSDFLVSVSGSKAEITWESSKNVGENGWSISYTIDGVSYTEARSYSENRMVIENLIPGSEYELTIKQQDGTLAIGGYYCFTTDEAQTFSRNFSGIQVTPDFFEFRMCKTPSEPNWNRFYLDDSDYTTSFSVNEKASFLIRSRRSYGYSDEPMDIMYLVRDTDGNLACVSSITTTWSDIWYLSYCELDVPKIPNQPGNYVMEIYWHGQLAHTQNFSVYE